MSEEAEEKGKQEREQDPENLQGVEDDMKAGKEKRRLKRSIAFGKPACPSSRKVWGDTGKVVDLNTNKSSSVKTKSEPVSHTAYEFTKTC